MMHIHNHIVHTSGAQPQERDLQERMSLYFNQRLGAVVCERSKAHTKPGSQHQSPHAPLFSSERWRTITSTPSVPRKWFASASARYTDRCWPPVHPNDTIRFVKPRRRYVLTLSSTSARTFAKYRCTSARSFRYSITDASLPVTCLKRSSRPGFGKLRASNTNPPPLPDSSAGLSPWNEKLNTRT